MKSNKTLLFIMTIIILALSGFIIWKFVLDKEVNDTKPITIGVNVVDAYNKNRTYSYEQFGEKESLKKSIIVPKIDLNTDGAVEFNKKLYNDYITYINDYNKDDGNFCNTSYEFKQVDDILFIKVSISDGAFHAGIYSDTVCYYYDITNDKELNLKEVENKKNINNDGITNQFVKDALEHLQYSDAIGYIIEYTSSLASGSNKIFRGIYPIENTYEGYILDISGSSVNKYKM